jgi:hypothetical protein
MSYFQKILINTERMKKIFILKAILPVMLGIFALQSCTKEDDTTFKVYAAFSEPKLTAPLDASTIKITGTTVDLKWVSTDKDGDTPKADVYFGLDPEPALYKSNVNVTTLNVPVELGKTYYWSVIMKDANGVMSYGETWSFYVYEPVGVFVGTYLCDEPAEDYSYDMDFFKSSPNSVDTDNYWNSGWAATFTLDYAKLTYSMPLTKWGNYSAIESGTINTTTGKMVGNYTIYYKGGPIETGVHTYTKY